MTTVLQWTAYALLGYLVVLNTGYIALGILTYQTVLRYHRRMGAYVSETALGADALPPITLIAPAHNEEATCVSSVRAFLSTEYPSFEILVVNDGSTDNTLDRLQEAFDLQPTARPPTSSLPTESVRQVYQSQTHPNLWVLDKENGGKADALNAGINFCDSPLFCAVDADTLVEGNGLARMVRPFLEETATVAVGGIVRVANGCTIRAGRVQEVSMPTKWLPKLQVLEYLRAFYFGRVGWDALGAMLVISGAFGLFRRETAVRVGGYATDTVGEDMELVVRMHRRLREAGQDYRVRFVPDPVAWTKVPSTLQDLGRQRDRWQRGLADSMIRHQQMLLNPRYGTVGMLAYPFFYMLETFGPILELMGYITFVVALISGTLSGPFMLAFFLVAFMLGTALSLSAVTLEELTFRRYEKTADFAQLLFLPVVETFGYRQINAWWRVRGLWSYFRGNKEWGAMERAGFDSPDD